MMHRPLAYLAMSLILIANPVAAKPQGDVFPVVAEVDRGRILRAADAALEGEPVTITAFRAELSDGGPNDYYSNGDYWWPDPAKEDGLPYIRRDGETNPGNFDSHRRALRQMRDHVAALAAAYRITGKAEYVRGAVRFLDTFFLDEPTRMKPHLEFAQAIPGVARGRGIGIIDTLHLIEIPKAIDALASSADFPEDRSRRLRAWFAEYLDWMLTSKNGKEEAATRNNHAVCYWLQVAVFAEFTGKNGRLAECRRRFKRDFIGTQMAPDGSFPLELGRTKPYGYSLFQLDNMATLCHMLSHAEENLWAYEGKGGRSMRKAVEFLRPYIADKTSWPHKPDVQAWEGWPTRQASLLFAAIAYQEPPYLELWKSLEPDPGIEEVRRNVALTQPILWLTP